MIHIRPRPSATPSNLEGELVTDDPIRALRSDLRSTQEAVVYSSPSKLEGVPRRGRGVCLKQISHFARVQFSKE